MKITEIKKELTNKNIDDLFKIQKYIGELIRYELIGRRIINRED